ncbi:HD domain-containing protein [Maricaulis sp. CAU 1757]
MQSRLDARMTTRWAEHVRAAGLTPAPAIGTALVQAYGEPHRCYHTLEHIADMLDMIEARASTDTPIHRLRMAAWFHDAVYDTRASDNEEQSAVWARNALTEAGAEPSFAAEVAALIRATADHQGGGKDEHDNLFLDIDISILGASPARYRAYADAIRAEYGWASDSDFQIGRSDFLQRILARERVFLTPDFEAELGDQARHNMQWELASLLDRAPGGAE